MRIILSNLSGVPIYEQIRQQIRDAILAGELKENQLLPSLRQLAKELKISVLTTTRAYSELEQEGYVTNVPGKGCYVRARNMELVREQLLRETEAHLTDAIASARRAGLDGEELHRLLRILLEEKENV